MNQPAEEDVVAFWRWFAAHEHELESTRLSPERIEAFEARLSVVADVG